MLRPLEAIVIFDGLVEPPHPKLVVCVQPGEGLFYRINSRPFFRPNVPLPREPKHLWLDHDSFLHIDPIMLDDYVVSEALRRHGVIGCVDSALSRDIKRLTLDLSFLTLAERQRICACLP